MSALVKRGIGLYTHQNRLFLCIGLLQIMHVVGRDKRNIKLFRHFDKLVVYGSLFGYSVALKFKVKSVLEYPFKLICIDSRTLVVGGYDSLRHGASETG